MMKQKYRTNTGVNGNVTTQKNGFRELRSYTTPFLAWDGEGISGINPTSEAQSYVMLCNSENGILTVDSMEEAIEGLSTERILNFICNEAERLGKRIHVGFALNYDINQWLKDCNRNQMDRLYKTGRLFFRNFNLEWIRGKNLTIRRYPEPVTAENRTTMKPNSVVIVQDVFSFFQMSFVKTLKEWMPFVESINEDIIARIHADKLRRSEFQLADAPEMIAYCREEVRLLADLMEEFRRQCISAAIVPNRWDGPGAIAVTLFQKHGIKSVKQDMTVSEELTSVNEAAQFAFTGGRIELVRYGHHEGPVYSYDIRSAYPSVIRNLPNLSRGSWVLRRYRSQLPKPAGFAIYRVTVGNLRDNPKLAAGVFPTWARLSDGSIHYRDRVTNWYWAPEYEILYRRFPESIKVHECWEFIPDDETDRPFQFVEEMYAKRAELKKAGNPAQLILKLGLNSLYGKTVQQVGRYNPEKDTNIPPYHQLEWAGFITASVRAKMTEAAYLAGATVDKPGPIISFETDGLITTKPIPELPLSSALGDWEVEEYTGITYVAPGVYWLHSADEDVKTKTRGFDIMSLSEQMVIDKWASKIGNSINGKIVTPYVPGKTRAFVAFGRSSKKMEWRSWVELERLLRVYPHSKRTPYPADVKFAQAAQRLCRAFVPPVSHVTSEKFKLKFPTNSEYEEISNGVSQEFGGGFIHGLEGAY